MPRPAYWVLRTYANARPRILLKVESTSPTFNISKGVTQLSEIVGAPYLDVVAAPIRGRRQTLVATVRQSPCYLVPNPL